MKLYWTNAPEDYDYSYTKTLLPLGTNGKQAYRLVVSLDDERFQAYQIPRYQSGLCQAHEVATPLLYQLFKPSDVLTSPQAYARTFRLSSAHITRGDSESLKSLAVETRGSARPFTVAEYDEGFFLFVPTMEAMNKSDFLEGLVDAGLTSAVACILLAARANGCDFLVLDNAEGMQEGLPVHEW